MRRQLLRLSDNEFETDAFVFTLQPSTTREHEEPAVDEVFPPVDHLVVEDVPIEEQFTERMPVSARAETQGTRRESSLVRSFKQYAERLGKKTIRKRIIPVRETKALYTDIYINEANLLIEAKGSPSRGSIRMALGQIADYRRFLNNPHCAILLPSKTTGDLIELAQTEKWV